MAAAASAITTASRNFLILPHHHHQHRRNLLFSSRALRCLSTRAAAHNTNVIDVLRERGLLESVTSEELGHISTTKALKVYCGFDPTAASLHIGNLLGLVALSWFRRHGHIAVAVVGGATARVGDPSGKSAERPELDSAALASNSQSIRSLIHQILSRNQVSLLNSSTKDDVDTIFSKKEQLLSHSSDKDSSGDGTEQIFAESSNIDSVFSEKEQSLADSSNKASTFGSKEQRLGKSNVEPRMGDFIIVDNYDWWKDFTLLDFLKDVGRYARVGAMMAKESVKKRLMSEEGMSYTEFTYQLLQGYDFLYMFKNMGVNVQIGGSDQWGNITAGTELIRKILQVEGAYGLTFPLLLKSDGTKFGKSEDGAIWLSPSMLSPYKFYQYFFSVADVDVVKFLKILTFMDMDEICELEEAMKKPDYVPNTAQRRLAEEVTRFVHGEEGLREALKATEALRPGAETELDAGMIEKIADDIPSFSLAYDEVLNSSLVDLAVSTGLLASKSAVRRLMKQGGLYLNNTRIDSEEKLVEAGDIVDGKLLLLSAGKKNKMVIKVS